MNRKGAKQKWLDVKEGRHYFFLLICSRSKREKEIFFTCELKCEMRNSRFFAQEAGVCNSLLIESFCETP